MKKNYIYLIVLILCMLPQLLSAQWVGGGTAENPYQISTVTHLKTLSTLVMNDATTQFTATKDKYWKVMNDIDMTGVTDFIPIGGWISTTTCSFTRAFAGTLDGNNKKIKNLTFNYLDKDMVGLFGLTKDATIRNLGMEGGSITGGRYTGSLIAYCGTRTKITACYSTVKITSSADFSYTGGLVGINHSGGVISSCYATGEVTGISEAGGLAGRNEAGTIENCYATGNVTATSVWGRAGGLVGYNNLSTIKHCYASPAGVTGTKKGMLIGEHSGGTITNCYYNNSLSGINGVSNNQTLDVTAKTPAELKSASMITALNGSQSPTPWKANIYGNNSQYPLLAWQTVIVISAPKAVTNLSITPGAKGALSAELSWTNPTQAMDGTTTSLTKVEVYRNAVLVKTITSPGATSSFTDSPITASGNMGYEVIAHSSVGAGQSAVKMVFVGTDIPVTVSGLTLTADGTKGKLNWIAPVSGVNGGWINPTSLKYRIFRMPDNKTVASDYTSTSYTDDDITSAGTYRYKVWASNSTGSSAEAVSNALAIGTNAFPKAVSNFMVLPEPNGLLKATLSWTNPTQTENGSSVTITKVEVYRNATWVKTFTSPGPTSTWVDNDISTSGTMEYQVKAYSIAGAGASVSKTVFVGMDVPAKVTNLTLTSDDGETALLTWTAPDTGKNGGWFNPATLRYKITRMPDGTVLTTTHKGTTYTDNTITAQRYYYYIVQPLTDAGSGDEESSNPVNIGPARVVPYTMGFEEGEDLDEWIIDSQAGNEWMNKSSVIHANNGNQYMMVNTSNLDLAMHSPKIRLETGKRYNIQFYIKAQSSNYPQKLTLELEGKNSAGTVIWSDANITNTNYRKCEVTLEGVESGDYYICFIAEQTNNLSNLYLDDFSVTEKFIHVEKIVLNEHEITIYAGEEEFILSAIVTPPNAYNKEVDFWSENPDIATINKNGLVKGVKAGTAKIVFKTIDLELTDTCTVNVLKVTPVDITLKTNPSQAGQVALDGGNDGIMPGTLVAAKVTQVNTGYTFTNWTVEGVEKSTEESYTFTASKDMTLVANFSEKPKYTVTLASNPVDNNEIKVSLNNQPQGVTSNDFYEGEKIFLEMKYSDRKYTFVNWTDGEGTVVSTEPNFQYTVPAKAVTLTANFTHREYTITLEANPAEGGSVEFTGCSNPFDLEELVKATATPNSGYEFVNWTVKDFGILISNNALMEFSALDNLTFTANFKTPQELTYTVTIIAEPAEAFEMLLGAGTHIAGSKIGLMAQAKRDEYKFVKWTNDLGEEFTENQIQDYILTGNRTFTAHAVPLAKYNLTVTATPSEGGTISGTMNGNNIPNLNGIHTEGTRIWLNAQTSFDYEFVNWTENGNEISTNPNFEYNVTKDATLTANFKEIEKYTIVLQASPEEGGTVYFNGYNGPFMPEDHVEVSCNTNPRYEFVNWTVDGVEVSTTPYYQFPATKSMTIVANFKEKVMYTINLQANPAEGGNIIFIANSGPFIPGEPVEVRVNYENPAYLFINWTADNTEVSNEPYYQFSATKSMTLVANFIKTGVETSYTVTLDKNYPEAGIVLGGGKYIENRSVTLRAETNPGFMFKHWEVVSTGQELSTEPIYTFTLTQATAIKAVYAKLYTVTAAIAPENTGTISGTGTFAESTTVTLTAAPKAGYAFKNWTASGSQVSTAAAYSFLLTDNTHLIAHFVSTNATLKSLSVNQGSLHVPFSPSVTNYTVNVANSIDKITLTAEADHANATVNGTGEKTLEVGKNEFTITVTAEDGITKKTYTVNVIRQSLNPSNDATLKSITLSHGVLSPAFSPTTTSYTVDVVDTVTNHTIAAEANHALATVNGHGERTLQLGKNKVEITVTAEDGTQKVYTVTIIQTKLGINKVEQQALSVTIYPNPVKDVLHIKTEERIDNATIYNAGGQQCMHLNQLNGNTINVSSLPAGMYILKLKTSKGEVINRFVKQ